MSRATVSRARRRLILGGAGLWVLTVRPASATPESMAEAIRALTGGREVVERGVTLELPRIADNGNVVPLTVKVASAQTAEDHVRSIHVFSEQNPVAAVVQMFLGAHYPKPEVSTRIRLAKTQRVIAIAEMQDGRFRAGGMQVEVTISACGDE
jgi:sulfur-oxidizing protein SoxY